MAKIFYIVIFLILVILGCAPWITGYYFKYNYLQLITSLNQRSQAKITVLSYESGWLTSHIVSQVAFYTQPTYPTAFNAPPSSFAEITTITLDQTVYHGPIVYDKNKHFITFAMASMRQVIHLSEKVESLLYGTNKTDGIGTVDSIYTFSGWWKNHIILSPVIIPIQFLVDKIIWDGAQGDMDIKMDGDVAERINMNIKFGEIATKSAETPPAFDLTIQPITEIGESARHIIGIYTGHAEMIVPSIIVKNNGVTIFSIEAMKVTGQSDVDKQEMYSVTEAFTANKIEMPNYIPALSPVDFKLVCGKINARQMAILLNTFRTAYDTPMNEKQATLENLIPSLITPATNCQASISANTSLGALTANATADWPQQVVLPKTIDEVTKNASLKADVRMAVPLADMLINKFIVQWSEQEAKQIYSLKQSQLQASQQSLAAEEQARKDAFRNKVAELIKKGELQLPAAIQILTLYDKQVSTSAFTMELQQLGIVPAAQKELVQVYSQLLLGNTVAKNPQLQTSQAAIQQEIEGLVKKQMDDLIQQGYVTKDNDYHTIVTYENGIIRLNGKELPPKLTTQPTPTQMPAAPAVIQPAPVAP